MISIRSSTTGSGTTSVVNGNFSVTKPASVVNGDYLVVLVGKDDDNAITAVDAGWTRAANLEYNTADQDLAAAIFYKKITDAGSEPASYTFDSDAGEEYSYWIGALSGVDQTTPEDVSFTGAGMFVGKENDISPNAPAVTTVTDGAFALAFWVNQDSASTQPGGSWADVANDVGAFVYINVCSQTFITAGTSTGSPEITSVGNTYETITGMFVFRPAVVKGRSFGCIT